ncbi:MAG TPA: hypothetical protein VJN71_04155 [Nitrososphaerales archaeon]|nr:hypothetical protein [Nitrososphaerales archaeon]
MDVKTNSTKVRVDFTSSDGAKYSINIDHPTTDNLTKLMDFVQTISAPTHTTQPMDDPIDTNFARVYGLIQTKLKFGSFTSNDVLQAYEYEFGIPTSLSVISTYLSRLANRSLLTRRRSGVGWEYKLTNTDPPLPNEPPNTSIIQR